MSEVLVDGHRGSDNSDESGVDAMAYWADSRREWSLMRLPFLAVHYVDRNYRMCMVASVSVGALVAILQVLA